MDLRQHLLRQMAFSRGTFGPGDRQRGVIDHCREELDEIEAELEKGAAEAGSAEFDDAATEWVDMILLSLDGCWRALQAAAPKMPPDRVADEVVYRIKTKQSKNEMRDWPDWRKANPDKAINHTRSGQGGRK
jgi:hypothetical protein